MKSPGHLRVLHMALSRAQTVVFKDCRSTDVAL